jgi:hypothetical protein
MSEKKGTTIWVDPDTRNKINKKKRKTETAGRFIRRLLGGKQ